VSCGTTLTHKKIVKMAPLRDDVSIEDIDEEGPNSSKPALQPDNTTLMNT
jgi:hypothetical protein